MFSAPFSINSGILIDSPPLEIVVVSSEISSGETLMKSLNTLVHSCNYFQFQSHKQVNFLKEITAEEAVRRLILIMAVHQANVSGKTVSPHCHDYQ